jgi:hypothetical protein
MHTRDKKYIQNSGEKASRKKNSEDPGVDGMLTLK